jgi:SAM-dependent methyltransferase
MDLWRLTDLCTPWCVHVAVTLRVAEQIQAGKYPIEEIAGAVGAHAESLGRVLRHLSQQGIFVEGPSGHFALNDDSRALMAPEARLGFDLDGIGGRMAHAWATMLAAVRTGRPAYHEAFGRPFWDDLEAHPEIAKSFDELMGPGHGTPDPEVLVNPSDWDRVATVVDVGGGTGALLAEILRTKPKVRGILVDLPRAVARSAEVFQAAGVEQRVTTSAQSFFDPLPSGGDLYLLKNVLSDWPDSEAVALLRRCAEAARPAGRVVAIGAVTLEEVASPELLMMVLVGGRNRTIEEFRALAGEAGLGVSSVGRQRSGKVLVEMVCAPDLRLATDARK